MKLGVEELGVGEWGSGMKLGVEELAGAGVWEWVSL